MANNMNDWTNTLDLVPVGWERPDWITGYYPDDLPEDWRLAYFANEFPSLLLPQAVWTGAADDDIEAWADDLAPDFRIYLYTTSETHPERLAQVSATLGRRIAGVIHHGSQAARPGRPARFSFHESPTEAACHPGPAACAVPGSLIDDLPAARRLLDDLSRRPSAAPAMLILDPVAPEALRRWWLLAQLTGVA